MMELAETVKEVSSANPLLHVVLFGEACQNIENNWRKKMEKKKSLWNANLNSNKRIEE